MITSLLIVNLTSWVIHKGAVDVELHLIFVFVGREVLVLRLVCAGSWAASQ